MGEYAIRTSDNARIKVGTCETNYYLRYEDRDKIRMDGHDTLGHFYRLPHPHEDDIPPGGYKSHEAPARLANFAPNECTETAGITQLRHDCGILLNLPCYHGLKLPAVYGDGVRIFWNGRANGLELKYIKLHTDGRILPVVGCKWCGELWRFEWEEVLPAIVETELRFRLQEYAK